MRPFFRTIGRGLRGAWWLLDATRRALLNLLLVAVLIGIVWIVVKRNAAPTLDPKTALVLHIEGGISEQRAGRSRSGALSLAQGQGPPQTRLRDVLRVLDAAAKDPQISHAVLVLDGLGNTGLPTLREVAAAIDRLEAAGKPVIAWGSGYDQRSYYLAAHASEVWMHPMGGLAVEGYGRYRSYFKDLFDRIGVDVNVVRAGKFKNAAETFSATEPSPETRESDAALFGSLWSTWTGHVERARKQPAGSVMQAIDSLPASLQETGGDVARWALNRKWIDALKTRDEMRTAMIERGARDDKTFRQIGWLDYLGRLPVERGGDVLGVIVAEGAITDGSSGPGGIGGESTAAMIRRAREDESVKALVLRVNSPGGSAFGSELVRRELELTRTAGKPVVVSMGDVAASGGYWISMAADEVIADEATITGSIGVVAMLPTAQVAYDKLGLHAEGATTTWIGGAYDVRRGVDPRFKALIQSTVDHIYGDFIGLVAKARKTTPERIDAVAQGRVWVGKDALARGLVDRLGGYTDALQSAARLGKLKEGWRVEYVEAQPGRLEQLMQRFGVDAATGATGRPTDTLPDAVQGTLLALGLATPATAAVIDELAVLAPWLDPRSAPAGRRPYAAVVHCLCSAP